MENWKSVKGFEGHYEVSDLGRVRSIFRTYKRHGIDIPVKERILKTFMKCGGYPATKLCKNGKAVHRDIHRLIAEAFIPNPYYKPDINHMNGIKGDHSINNLEWCTHQENISHAHKTGLIVRPSGSESYAGKRLKDNNSGETFCSIKEASEKLGIKLSTLRCYMAGHRKNKTSLSYVQEMGSF